MRIESEKWNAKKIQMFGLLYSTVFDCCGRLNDLIGKYDYAEGIRRLFVVVKP